MKQEDKELFCNSVRTEVKATGLMDTPETCWDFFIDKVRQQFWGDWGKGVFVVWHCKWCLHDIRLCGEIICRLNGSAWSS